MIKRFAVFAVLLFAFTTGFAAEKIGFVDSKKIFSNYRGISDINRQIDKETSQWRKQMEEMQSEISKLEREYKDQEAMLSEDAKARKQDELSKKRDKLNAFVEEIWGEEGKAVTINKQLMKPVVDKINGILKKLAEDEGYSLILDVADGNILYARADIDLTQRVIDELNKEFFIPVASLKKYIVYDIAAADKETRNEQYHLQLARTLYISLKKENVLEPVNINDVNTLLKNRGITNIADLSTSDAISYASELLADYAVTGIIKMSGGRIIIEVTLLNVKTRSVEKKIEREAASAIEFNSASTEILTELKKIMQQ